MGSSFDASYPTSARHTTESERSSERGPAWLTFPLYANGLVKNQFRLVQQTSLYKQYRHY